MKQCFVRLISSVEHPFEFQCRSQEHAAMEALRDALEEDVEVDGE